MGDYLTCAKANVLGCYPVHLDDNCRRLRPLDVAGETASPPSQISTNGERFRPKRYTDMVKNYLMYNQLFLEPYLGYVGIK